MYRVKRFSVYQKEYVRSEEEKLEEKEWDNDVSKVLGGVTAGTGVVGGGLLATNLKKATKGDRLMDKTRKAISNAEFKLKGAKMDAKFYKDVAEMISDSHFKSSKESALRDAAKGKAKIDKYSKRLNVLRKHEKDLVKKYGGNINRTAAGSALLGTSLLTGTALAANEFNKYYKKRNKKKLDNSTNIRIV